MWTGSAIKRMCTGPNIGRQRELDKTPGGKANWSNSQTAMWTSPTIGRQCELVKSYQWQCEIAKPPSGNVNWFSHNATMRTKKSLGWQCDAVKTSNGNLNWTNHWATTWTIKNPRLQQTNQARSGLLPTMLSQTQTKPNQSLFRLRQTAPMQILLRVERSLQLSSIRYMHLRLSNDQDETTPRWIYSMDSLRMSSQAEIINTNVRTQCSNVSATRVTNKS